MDRGGGPVLRGSRLPRSSSRVRAAVVGDAPIPPGPGASRRLGRFDSVALLHALASSPLSTAGASPICYVHHGLRPEKPKTMPASSPASPQTSAGPSPSSASSVAGGAGVSPEAAARAAATQRSSAWPGSFGADRFAVGIPPTTRPNVLMRLLQGAGPRGLSGIPCAGVGSCAPSSVSSGPRFGYLAARPDFPWVEDATNRDPRSRKDKTN